MLTHEIESVMSALCDAIEGHDNKFKMKEGSYRFWSSKIFSGHDMQACLDAIDKVSREGKPNPKTISAAIEQLEAPKRQAAAEPEENTEPATDRVNDAWLIYLHLLDKKEGAGVTGFPGACDIAMLVLKRKRRLTDISKSEALEIVNQQCAKMGLNDHIHPDYRIDSYYDEDII